MPRENKFAATDSRPVRTMNAESFMSPDRPVNPRPTRTNDTRRFEVPRPSNLNGYREALHNALSGMGLRLPNFEEYSGRLVRSRGQMWELRSPNSLQLPHYPGGPEMNHCPKMAILPQNRKCDGHLGRFDYTVSPQVWGMPWWPWSDVAYLTTPRPVNGERPNHGDDATRRMRVSPGQNRYSRVRSFTRLSAL
jgi:hypothetical protein